MSKAHDCRLEIFEGSWMMVIIGVIAGVVLFGGIFGVMAYCAQERLKMLATFLKEDEVRDEQVHVMSLHNMCACVNKELECSALLC